jgi:hypothetical protein
MKRMMPLRELSQRTKELREGERERERENGIGRRNW